MEDQVLKFLEADRHAILATKGRSGAPQLTPVWYVYEDGVLYVSAQTRTVKVKNLRRDPTVTICVDGGRGDARYVALYGKAELIEPGERQRDLRWRIVRHYYADEAEAAHYYETVKDTEGVIVTLRPERTVSMGFGQS